MSRYAAAYAEPKGPGDARPTALQIIQDEGLEGKLVGKVIVITGAAGGIGLATARALSVAGATLILTVRNPKKAEASLQGILKPGRDSLVQMDNNSLASVRAAAQTILDKTKGQVNVLVNNAGILSPPELTINEDGHEITFAVNHLSHFLLFQLLKPALLASSTPDFNSRVVNVASQGHRGSKLLDSDNYNFEKGDFNPWTAYAVSKLASIYMATEIERRYGDKGLHGLSVHPGTIDTEIGRSQDPAMWKPFLEMLGPQLRTPEQGAATSVVAAVGKEWEGKGGYLDDCDVAKRGEDDFDLMKPGTTGHTFNIEDEKRLWKDSLKIVGVKDDQ